MQPIFIISSFILSICSVAASYGMTDTMGRMHSDAQF
ncbi:GGGtGRT protein, partial [uncultured Bacteroides sp.]